MTALAANITDTQTLIPVDAGLTNGSFQLPLYYTVDSEAIRVTGRAHRTTWLVERGIAGTTAASHSSAATLTRYYPEAATGAGAGGVPDPSGAPDGQAIVVASGAYSLEAVFSATGTGTDGASTGFTSTTEGSGDAQINLAGLANGDGEAGIVVESVAHGAGEANLDLSASSDADGDTRAAVYSTSAAGAAVAAMGAFRGAGEASLTFNVTAAGLAQIIAVGLPTADPVVAGQLWNDAGTLKVSTG